MTLTVRHGDETVLAQLSALRTDATRQIVGGEAESREETKGKYRIIFPNLVRVLIPNRIE
jgi:hypothetical protein